MFGTEHEFISFCKDSRADLCAIIAIHSTQRGPALGGTRIFPYPDEKSALRDVLELSEAMTWKAAAADLPFGGSKAVILADPRAPGRYEKLKAFCKFINMLNGNFQTGEDIGTYPEDIVFMRQFTPFAHCSRSGSPDYLDTSALTARGVLRGMEASAEFSLGSRELKGKVVALQGLGKVGSRLASMLAEADVKLIISDTNENLADQISEKLQCRKVSAEEIYSVRADIFAPCAVGHTVNTDTVPQLKVRIIAGSANNQLSDPSVAQSLQERNILYAPDFVINAGGLISAMLEMGLEDESTVLKRVDGIGARLREIYFSAAQLGSTTLDSAHAMVRGKLQRSR